MHAARPDHGVKAAAQAWLAASEEVGDHAGQTTALGFLAKVLFWEDQAAAAADEVWWRVADQAVLAGDACEEADALVYLLISGMYGPVPVEAALERCDAIANRDGASHKVRHGTRTSPARSARAGTPINPATRVATAMASMVAACERPRGVSP